MSASTQPASRLGLSPSFYLLRSTFLRRFLDNELLSFGAEAGPQVWIWLFALGMAPAILQPIGWSAQYARAMTQPEPMLHALRWGHTLGLIKLSMCSTAIVTALAWEALLLDRRDVLILSPLPISWRTICGAKAAALLMAWGGFALVINVVPSVLFALVGHGHDFAIIFFITHFASAMAASAFVFAALIALQALLLNTVSAAAFRRLVTVVQALALFAALMIMLIRPLMEPLAWPRAIAERTAVTWFPPMWYVGLAESLRGTTAAGFHDVARVALIAFAGALVIAAIAFVGGFRRHVRRVVESPEMGTHGSIGGFGQILRRAAHFFIRHPIERATFDFVIRSLARSPRHRLLIGGALGLGIALTLPALFGLLALVRSDAAPSRIPGIGFLGIPLLLQFLLLLTLRIGFRLPTDVGAAWVMRLIANGDERVYLAGARKAMFAVGVLAPQLPLIPCYALVWGPIVALQHFVICCLMGQLLVNLLMARVHSVPFTSVAIGTVNASPAIWPLLPLALGMYSVMPAGVEARVMDDPFRFGVMCLVLIALNGVDALRRQHQTSGRRLVFDIEPVDSTVTLNLASARIRAAYE